MENIYDNQIIYCLSAIVSQSGWDLGFKNPELNVECIFHEKFRPFLSKIGLMSYIGDCKLCNHNTKKKDWVEKRTHVPSFYFKERMAS